GKVADASLGPPQGRLVRVRRGRRIVRRCRHGRHPGLLGLSRNLRRRHDRFVRGARSGPSARAHAAGRQEGAARAENLLARSVHALDRCRARPWPFSLERQRARLAARRLPVRGRGRLRPGTMGYAREPVFLLSHSHPDRPRPTRYHHGTLRLRPPSWIHRRDSDYSGKRTRARIVARGRAACDLQPAVSAPSRHHGGPNSSSRTSRLCRLRRAGPMAASPGHLVRAKLRLGSVLQRRLAELGRRGAVEFAQKRLFALSKSLGDKPYLDGDRFTAGDLMMSTVLRILQHPDIVTNDKRLAAYIERCTARSGFNRALNAQLGDFRIAAERGTEVLFEEGTWGKGLKLASKRKDMQWQRTRFASGTIRTPRLLPDSTPRPFPTARWVPSTGLPVTTHRVRRATC